MLFALVVWVFCGIGATAVASNRGANGCLWFGLGFIFGPFGLAFAFAAGSNAVCQACRKRVHPDATKCPYCQSEVAKPQSSRGIAMGVVCPKCTFVNDGEWKFCGQCAEPLPR